MDPKLQVIVTIASVIVLLMIGKKGFLWIGRWIADVSGRMFGHRWHGFPKVHRVKHIRWTRECVTDDKVEIIGGGLHCAHIRKKSEIVTCRICGKQISEQPLGSFINTSRGQLKIA